MPTGCGEAAGEFTLCGALGGAEAGGAADEADTAGRAGAADGLDAVTVADGPDAFGLGDGLADRGSTDLVTSAAGIALGNLALELPPAKYTAAPAPPPTSTRRAIPPPHSTRLCEPRAGGGSGAGRHTKGVDSPGTGFFRNLASTADTPFNGLQVLIGVQRLIRLSRAGHCRRGPRLNVRD
jgi:hypothetical protein